MTKIDEAKVVSEAERAAAEAAIAERLGPDAPKPVSGRSGNSPYSGETVVMLATGAAERGFAVGPAMSRTVCPQCGRKVAPEHFACCSGAKGGRVGGKASGAAKVRGDSEHYRAMVSARKDRKANASKDKSGYARKDGST